MPKKEEEAANLDGASLVKNEDDTGELTDSTSNSRRNGRRNGMAVYGPQNKYWYQAKNSNFCTNQHSGRRGQQW